MTDLERYNKDKASVIGMVKFILIVLIAAAAVYFSTKIIVIIIPFLIGFILAKTSYAIAEQLCRLFKLKDKPVVPGKLNKQRSAFSKLFFPKGMPIKKPVKIRTALYTYIVLLIILILAVFWCSSALVYQANEGIKSLSSIATNLDYDQLQVNTVDKLSVENGGFLTEEMTQVIKYNLYGLSNKAIAAIPAVLSAVVSWVWEFIGNLPITFFMIICVLLSGYYFINDGKNVMRCYMKNVPNKRFRAKSISLINNLSMTLFRVLGGYLSLLIITAFEAFIVFKIADIRYAVIFSLITGIIDFLPVLGISATMIPLMIYNALNGNYYAVAVLLIGMALMTVIRRLIEPAILGKSMHLHPLIMLLGMILGVYVWGAVGFLLGPTVFIIVIQVIKVFEIDKKILSFASRILKTFMQSPEPVDNSQDVPDENGSAEPAVDSEEKLTPAE